MLYVFHVDAGLMTTYDMNLTLQSVACLKLAIERKTKIPASSLVLLVSGGEVLLSDHMVSSYSAGTDTNPIYMFSKPSVKESHLKQSMCGDLSPIVELSTGEFRSDIRALDGKSVAELKAQVEMCCSMSPTVHTVASCASLAQQFSDLALEVLKSCEQLVHDQHLQHQGWAAVVANLEDIFNEFCERSKNFKESFRNHRLKKEEYHEKLNALNEVLESLGKIPILPALQVNAEAHRFSAFDVFEETDFEGHPYRVTHPQDSASDKQSAQDFGVDFKLSDEDVFDKKEGSSSKNVASSEAEPRIEDSDEGVTFTVTHTVEKEKPTLLHWILAQGNKASLQDILDYCQKGLALIDAEPLKEREAELYHILEYANLHGLKQIKGIEDRLYGLEQLLTEVKKLQSDQHNQAASLIRQYREHVQNTSCDPSALPTLVQSHCCQLEMLLKGHQSLVDIRRRIAKSKDELSYILKSRLEAVLMIENSMSVQDAHAMLSFQCFNRLARYFGIVAQLHRAPRVFVRAVTEVARRRKFSDAHLKWATDLAEKLLNIHNEEVSRRQEFNTLFEGHFLKSLFPGMTDLPPAFASQAPPAFDTKLPKLTDEDVEYVNNTFPELVKDVPNYDMEATVKFFQQRLTTSEHEERDVDVQVDVSKDLESETDTSDYERLSRQGSKKQTADMSTLCAPHTQAASTVTEVRTEFVDEQFYIDESLPSSLELGRLQDNMDSHKINMEKLQEFLVKLCGLCRANIVFIKEELFKLRTDLNHQKKWFGETYIELLKEWEKNNEEAALRFREQTQRLTVDHELELSDMKAALAEKEDVIEALIRDKEDLKIEHNKEIERLEKEHQSTKELLAQTREEINAFEKRQEEIETNKQREIKELQEKMHQDYKAEIESLRSRFRLVALTNMDRSPSESSLEKIERTDVIEISNHNAIVMQTKENAEVEKEEAVRVAVGRVEEEWQVKLETEVSALKTKYETEKQVTINDITRRLITEKDRQLELLREREQTLVRECTKYRETIQQLTDPETNDYDALLKTQMATLENEKALLQQQVQDLKRELEKRIDDSDKSKEEDSDGRSSPKKEVSRRSRTGCHTPVGLAAGALSLASCLPGHTVLVMWDPQHLNYTIMQEASIMYFVHSESLPALDLSIQVPNERERKLYTVATVESKEYCYAKKASKWLETNRSPIDGADDTPAIAIHGNRYHMPRGSRFYRVRVRPLRPHLPHPACCPPHPSASASAAAASAASAASAAHEHKHKDARAGVLSVLRENRPVKKWLTYVHAPDIQKSVDTSQSSSSNTGEASRVGEVATGTLINLESPVSPGEQPSGCTYPDVPHSELVPGEDQLDSIEASEHWHNARMQMSSASAITDMECSVGRVLGPEPWEVAGSAVSVVARGAAPPDSEVAEEASP